MAAECQSNRRVVGHDALPFGGRLQQRAALIEISSAQRSRSEWQRTLGPRHFPECQVAIATQLCERTRGSERFEISAIESGALCEILHTLEPLFDPGGLDTLCAFLRERFHQAQTQPQRRFSILASLEGAFDSAGLHINRAYLHVVLTCIAHELRWCVKTHGLTVEKRTRECRRFVMFQPRRVIRE